MQKIQYYGADYTVAQLIKMMDKGDFDITDHRLCWDVREPSAFIEHLLMGFPMYPISFSKTVGETKLTLMDGKNRLLSLKYFYSGGLPSGNPFTIYSANQSKYMGKGINDLEAGDRTYLDEVIVPVIIYTDFGESTWWDVFQALHDDDGDY